MSPTTVVLIFIVVAAFLVFVLPSYFKDKNVKLLKNRNLRSRDIDNIPDEELETAVLEWIFSQMDNKGEIDLSVIKSLPEPCRLFYSTYVVTEEVLNGGFAQCFINETRFYSKYAQKGFIVMGLDALADITAKANDLFDEFSKQHSHNLSDLALLCENSELEALTQQFVDCEETELLSDTVCKYIRDNRDDFGR